MSVQLKTINKINEYDVTFLKLTLLDDEWITAYVRLGALDENTTYANETYREGEVIGIDTHHLYNQMMDIEQKMKDAKEQISDVINSYTKRRYI